MTTTYELSENIQRGIIYLAKSDRNFLTQAMPMIKAEYFEFPSHQKIYHTIVQYYLDYQKLPSDDFILQDIKKIKTPNELISDYKDELDAINSLDQNSLNNEDYLLDLVESFAKEQSLKDAIIRSAEFVKSKKYSEIEPLMREALTVGRNVDLGLDYFTDVDERWDRLKNDTCEASHRTIFESLNEALEGGLADKELAMVVAPPGVGKSLYLANQAVRSCLDGSNVLYVSLEMSEDRVAQRLDSIFSRIRQSQLKDRCDDLKNRLEQVTQTIPDRGRLKIKEFPTKRATVNQVRAYLQQLNNYESFTPDVIIIDYLELLATDAQTPEYQAQERLAQELRGMAIESKCLVWTATQTNREGKKVNLITDTELADSYGKTRVCDLVLSINQNEEEFDKGKSRVYVIKSRNGRARFIIPARMDYDRLVIAQGQ
jgi:replicative DNA helicase|tara:strand:- start:143 stop:1429 length:1287 start_codon:yes stop_codon:yes gene_type:complete